MSSPLQAFNKHEILNISKDQEVSVDYNQPIMNLPQKVSLHYIHHNYLLLAPELPSWLVLNALSYKIYTVLAKHFPIQDVIQFIASTTDLEGGQAEQEVDKVIQQILDKNFFEPVEQNQLKTWQNITPLPLTVALRLTHACNLTCKHCSINAGLPLKDEITLEEWKTIIDAITEYSQQSTILLVGGEPLLFKQIEQLLQYIQFKNLSIEMTTNGTQFHTLQETKIISSFVDDLTLSLDGATEDVHDAIRGKGSFRKILASIDYLKKLHKPFSLNICVMKSNAEDLKQNLPHLIGSINQKYIRDISLNKVSRVGRALTLGSEELFDNIEVKAVIKEIYDHLFASGTFSPRYKHKKILTKSYNCGFGLSMSISADGQVYACHGFNSSFGNIRDQDFKHILKNITSLHQRTNVDNLIPCKTCDIKYICKGGCKADFLNVSKDPTQVICSDTYKKTFYHMLITQG